LLLGVGFVKTLYEGLQQLEELLTEGWFLSEVLRVLPNLVEVRYFTTPTPALEN
jgi:hypothetical protein